jgi:methyltransferase-like protein
MTYSNFFKKATDRDHPPYAKNRPSMSENNDNLKDIDWSLTTWEGSRREKIRRWSELSFDEILNAQEEMAELAAINRTVDSTASPHKLTTEEQHLANAIATEGLAIQDRFRPEPLYRTTGKGHYESQTVDDIAEARLRATESKKEPE